MLTLEEMKKIRKKKKLSYEEIARVSGVSISSVQKLFGSEDSNPRPSTLEKLNKVFNNLDTYSSGDYGMVSDVKRGYNIYGNGKMVSGSRDPMIAQTGYTYEDYLSLELPERKRVEIIDGVIYDMASPSETHQLILGFLFNHITNELRKRKRRCLAIIAPFDVRLDFDDGPTTVVQPDLLVKCSDDMKKDGESKDSHWVPRFVLEVLSPSTRSKDMFIKTKKYKESGIIEYWMIDDQTKQVIKYNFDKDTIELFGYEEKIPIDIFDGDITIDTRELKEYIELYADILES